MAILGIRIIGDPVLRTQAQEVTDFGPELQKLVEDMDQTMEDVHGAGLAAPQVGVSLRVFTYQIGDERGHIVNPVLELSDDFQEDQVEGCLSIPGVAAPVPRRRHVKATGFDKFGNPVALEGAGMLARCFQHETDHLFGVLCHDRSVPRSFADNAYVPHLADLPEAVRRLGLTGDIERLGDGEVVVDTARR